jgi:aspartyl-tRNA(Asn)/glutamyl-tRNA(Gln) amidotransferase subunit B
LKKGLPELPDAKRQRLVNDYALSEYDAGVLTADKETAEYFEKTRLELDALHLQAASEVAKWVTNAVLGALSRDNLTIDQSKVSPAQLAGILILQHKKIISGKIAKDVFEIVWNEGGDPAEIVEKRGLKQVTDMGAIETAVDAVIAANPDKVTDAKANPKAIGWFVGQVMRSTGGKANPQAVNELLRKKLGL